MSDEDERLKNFIIFKVPLTDKEMGLDKPMPFWQIIVVLAVLLAMILGFAWAVSK